MIKWYDTYEQYIFETVLVFGSESMRYFIIFKNSIVFRLLLLCILIVD